MGRRNECNTLINDTALESTQHHLYTKHGCKYNHGGRYVQTTDMPVVLLQVESSSTYHQPSFNLPIRHHHTITQLFSPSKKSASRSKYENSFHQVCHWVYGILFHQLVESFFFFFVFRVVLHSLLKFLHNLTHPF